VGSTFQYLLFASVMFLVAMEIRIFGVDLWIVLVKGGAIGAAMLVNYVFESLFTWRVHES
jgi:putative flippase GtrA